MSIQELINLANGLFATLSKWGKMADFSITGGEPFLKKELFTLLEHLNLSQHTYAIDILSNGTLIDIDAAKRLKDLNKLKFVQLSLEGASQETNDKIRGQGTFEKVIQNIRMLSSYKIDVNIMFTLQRSNMQDIPSLIDLAIEQNVRGLTIERMIPIGSASEHTDKMLSPEEIRDIFQYIADRSDLEYDKGRKLHILKYRPLWVIIDPCRAKVGVDTAPKRELGASCSIGLDGICILPDATVLPCRRLPIPIGNLQRDSLHKIWHRSELLWRIADKRNLKGKCSTCQLVPRCGGCRAMAYAYTGDYLSEDPQCWA